MPLLKQLSGVFIDTSFVFFCPISHDNGYMLATILGQLNANHPISYSFSTLKPDANGKYVKGLQGLGYGVLYAKKSMHIHLK